MSLLTATSVSKNVNIWNAKVTTLKRRTAFAENMHTLKLTPRHLWLLPDRAEWKKWGCPAKPLFTEHNLITEGWVWENRPGSDLTSVCFQCFRRPMSRSALEWVTWPKMAVRSSPKLKFAISTVSAHTFGAFRSRTACLLPTLLRHVHSVCEFECYSKRKEQLLKS